MGDFRFQLCGDDVGGGSGDGSGGGCVGMVWVSVTGVLGTGVWLVAGARLMLGWRGSAAAVWGCG